jgi:cycloeucalenol cycloisomerase
VNNSPDATPRWFSENESKAWAEKFFLIYSPLWMLQMGLVMGTGLTQRMGDLGFMLVALCVASPLVVYPAIFRRESHLGRRWFQTYWFKANLYIFIFAFVGNYFLSEYFFDVLGMIYNYPMIQLNLDSELLGTGQQRVPIIMFLLTQAYFITYHTSAVVVLRRLRGFGIPLGIVGWGIAVFAIAYTWAWCETRAMANPWIAEQFSYQDMDRMLTYGSIFYACFFVVSFPIFYEIDEAKESAWSLRKVCAAALAASMLVFLLLDFWAKLIGPI